MIPARSGRVNFGGRPPEYFGANESNPSALKLWMTSLTRSSEVKAILAMAGTSILWADHSTIWALRHRTTEPDPRRTIERSFVALLVGDVPHCHAFCHGTTLRDRRLKVVDARP